MPGSQAGSNISAGSAIIAGCSAANAAAMVTGRPVSAAFLVIGGADLLARGVVQRIPRSAVQLLVGTLVSSFGTFWAVEGLGIAWPGGDGAVLALVGWYVLAAATYVGLLHRPASHDAGRRARRRAAQ